jgi:hypothetical protein
MTAAKTEAYTTDKAQSPVPRKRIGSIVYEVEIHFSPDAKETMNDKILRLIKHDMETAW